MKLTRNLALVMATLAFGAAPAVAIASGSSHGKSATAPGQTKSTKSANTKTSNTSSSTKAYGRYCQNELKKHVKGMKGTPFSQCVTAAAHAAKSPKTTPTTACGSELKKHVKGMKGTPFSQCVTAAAKAQANSH